MRTLRHLACIAILAAGACSNGADRWAGEIERFEQQDRTQPPPQGAVLFVGSSSILGWSDLPAAFPGVELIQRGFGGAELRDVVHFAPRIVLPYRPRLVVLYGGENDLGAGRSPAAVLRDFEQFTRLVHRELPAARIVFVSIKPSPSRLALLGRMREVNALIRGHTLTDERLQYVDVFTPMLGADGKPRPDLFVDDALHMNAAGYALWTSLLRPLVR